MAAEYTEPTNEQLANFLVLYAGLVPGAEDLELSAPVLATIMDHNETYRQAALKRHREFQHQVNEYGEKMKDGMLQCAHIRPNGKNCPNFNEPGSYYCGLHKDSEEK
jgi:hypothetical protein